MIRICLIAAKAFPMHFADCLAACLFFWGFRLKKDFFLENRFSRNANIYHMRLMNLKMLLAEQEAISLLWLTASKNTWKIISRIMLYLTFSAKIFPKSYLSNNNLPQKTKISPQKKTESSPTNIMLPPTTDKFQ